MSRILKKVAFLVGFTSLAVPFMANAYSIADAIKASRANNLNIKTSRDDLKSTKTLKTTALSTILPSINAQANFTETHFKAQAARTAYGTQKNRAITFNVQQPLFNGGNTLFNFNYAKNSINSAEFTLLSTKEKIILETINAYEDLLTKRELYRLGVNKEEAMKKHLLAAKASLELGEATITDVSLAASNLANATSEKENAKGNMINAEANFTAITGDPAPSKMDPIKINKISTPANLDEFLQLALQKNSNIKKTQSDVNAAKNQKQLAYSKLSPQVNAIAQFARSNTPKNLADKDGDTYGIQVAIPIFQGGAEYAEIKKAKYQERKFQHLHDSAVTTITQNAIKAWNSYYTTKSIIESTAKTVVAAQDTLNGMEEEAKVGTRTMLDVLDAENQLFDAKVKNRQAHMDNVVALFTIYALTSTLNQMNFSEY